MKSSNFEPYLNSTNVRNISFPFRMLKVTLTLSQWIYPRAVANFVREKFFTPLDKPLTRSQENWLHRANSYDIYWNGKIIKAWKIGKGPSILFAHGWNGRGVQFHHFFQYLIDAGYSVIFYDAPAHGLSAGSMTNYLEITASLKKIFEHEIGNDIIGVVAHSMGSSVIINHFSRFTNEIPIVFIAPALRLMELLFQSFQMHGVPKKTYIKLIREVEEKYQIPLDTQNPIDLIHQLKNNILIIHDKDDRTTPIEPSIWVSKNSHQIELMKTEGLGHNKLLKQKEIIDETLRFLINHQPVEAKLRESVFV